jgi:hypothetical protein
MVYLDSQMSHTALGMGWLRMAAGTSRYSQPEAIGRAEETEGMGPEKHCCLGTAFLRVRPCTASGENEDLFQGISWICSAKLRCTHNCISQIVANFYWVGAGEASFLSGSLKDQNL